MQHTLIEYVFLILIILALVLVANKLRLPYPIVLVIGGLLLSLTSAFSDVIIDPELVFLIFLPPLLYEAAWQTSWKNFWKFRRVITGFAFPIVILTSCVVAIFSNAFIPGFTLALGFLLGGIISPPDAVSATTIMREVNAPKTLVSVIEGESLLNDASSLIVFRFALAAIITGEFVFSNAAVNFLLVIVMGIAIGLAVGFIFYGIHRLLPVTPSIEVILTLVTPYCMYYAAEHFHFSGVLAVVSGGLLLSQLRRTLLNYRSRIEGVNVWTNLVFVLNGFIFLLIGLQLPAVTKDLGDISLKTAVGYALAISGILIVTRMLCTYGTVLFTRFMSRYITVADAKPDWKIPLIAGWSGMRGVVSLAAALSIPLFVNGERFPYRNLILFITFVVILVTLVLQGLTLPWLIRKLKPTDKFMLIPVEKQELFIRKKLAAASAAYVQKHHSEHLAENRYLEHLHAKFEMDDNEFQQALEDPDYSDSSLTKYDEINLQILENQRKLLDQVNKREEFDEEIIRKYLALIDLEEYKLREKQFYRD
jgi:Na+/H+ antiporter